MKQHPIPMKGGFEYDALSGWRKVIRFRAGQRKAAKQSYAKRVRQFFKREKNNDEECNPVPRQADAT